MKLLALKWGGRVGVVLSIRAQDVVRLREVRVDKGELIDRRGDAEAGHVCRQQLRVERVGGDLRLELLVHHHAHALFLHFY